MPFVKLGELIEISRVESTASCLPAVSPEILENFRKVAANLKKVAPKAEDFLYFSAVMMHAAEAAGINDDGTVKLNAKGHEVEVGWDKRGNTWRWMSNDPSIKPYKNSNGDIFPEEELVKAYKKWVGKPLCIDHKSSSVDHVRGFIVDTYYDRNLKRVIALCALDKAGYPQLARQVATGVSNCVSMGTAVGKAICSDCATVARTEQDFCDHMRRKSCYGEINVDLNPIELSIVVNGADPKANIKHIIAAANTLNAYVDSKQQELQKFADNFTANLNFTNGSPNIGSGAVTNVTVNSKDLDSFKTDVEKAIADFQSLQASLNEEKMQSPGNETASDQLLGDTNSETDSGLAPPHARYASTEVGVDPIAELRRVILAIETKLNQITKNFDKLANTSTINIQEENMSGTNNINKQGYYQGAGGVNEPTPGQVKYPKDPLNEQLREREDKQMVGQNPFPGVGPVDGMHPSPDSADPSDELARKKMLARAQYEERQNIIARAKAALQNKEAYFQGGGGPNEPTPGKVKYPSDKLNEQLRDREDKQMVGQKPFPGVGAVDGLHPSPSSADVSDELKRKQMLARASALSAKFAYATNEDGSRNLGACAWEVYRGDKLILAASVNELSGNKPAKLYSKIATKEFGASLLDKVKTGGVNAVTSLISRAQADLTGGAAPAAPAAPVESLAPAANENAPEDAGKDGDAKESASDMAETIRDLSSDLLETTRALEGERAEMGDAEGAPTPDMGVAASFSTNTLTKFRKELNGMLTTAMKESIANLNDHAQELDMIAGMYDKGAFNSGNQELVESIKQDAMTEAKAAVADGFKLLTAFVKYARGTKAIVKRAEMESELEALAEGENMTGEHDANDSEDLMNMIADTNADLDDVKNLMGDDDLEGLGDQPEEFETVVTDEDVPVELADANDIKAGDLKPETELPEAMLHQASFGSKAGRAALRAKLAADALGKEDDGEIQDMSHAKFSDMLGEADRLADGQTELDVKPSDNLGRVETLPEVNKAMMELAKAPPKVRKEAEVIHQLVSQGKLDPTDLEELVSQGLDKDAVAYYKKYFAQADGGSEFASELVKEHVKAHMEEELKAYKTKIARAYELAYEMVEVGLCGPGRLHVTAQVDEVMKFNDESIESLKKVIAHNRQTLSKSAGRLPQVGVIGSGEINVAAPADDDWSQLSAAFAKTSKRMF